MSKNQRLQDAIRQAGRTIEDVAGEVGADPKTVGRWVTTGRLPRPASRRALADVLGIPPAVLWPEAGAPASGATELVGIYASRRELSPATVASLLKETESQVDIVAYAALWLWDTVPHFGELLCQKLADGVGVRVCLGDPTSDAVRLRGEEESLGGDGMASRCRLALSYAASVGEGGGDVLRTTEATLYNSIYRFDDDLLVNTHFLGNPASDSPVLYLHHKTDGGVVSTVLNTIDRVWDQAQPLAG
jgi:transcriptional regulator with XRE-family HTH domain